MHPFDEKSKTYFHELKKNSLFFFPFLKFRLTKPENLRKREDQTEGVETFY